MIIKFFKAKNAIAKLYKKFGIYEQSEVDWLFCYILNTNKLGLLTTDNITNKQYARIIKIAKRRIKGIPLAKLIKKWEFYGREFRVNKNVLTPRQETELLVEKVIEDYKVLSNKKILDLCTGSGAIAITLACELNAEIIASDISRKALSVAKYNAKAIDTNINFKHSDLFDKIEGKFDAIVSNPPYIKTEVIKSLQVEVKKYDPMLALDGGKNGLNFYKEIIKKAPQKLNKNGKIYLELGIGQTKQVKKMLEKDFKNILIIKDYNNIERIIYASKG